MPSFLKWIIRSILAALILAIIYVFGILVPATDANKNQVIPHEPYPVSDAAQTLHESLYIADLHTDSLLWRRNSAKRNKRGHVDLPRLRDGGVDFQIFSAVTKSPRGLNFDENDANAPDDIALLARVQLWPIMTWNSIYERAAFQAHRLQKIEAAKVNKFIIARKASDLAKHGLPENIMRFEEGTDGCSIGFDLALFESNSFSLHRFRSRRPDLQMASAEPVQRPAKRGNQIERCRKR